MEEIVITTLDELETCFSKYKNGHLFRGQTDHYLDTNGNISLSTSFSRHGCIPPLMFKWIHYSKAIIRALGGGVYHRISLELSQAVLQHYGWRSFFVDLTKSPHIACWFAANEYDESKIIHMCDDYDGNPVYLIHKEARYSKTCHTGHVYIIDIQAIKRLDIGVYDLTEVLSDSDTGILRIHAQDACLVGNLNDCLPPQCIKAHLVISQDVLIDYYHNNGVDSTSDIFPDRSQDFILQSLLSIPWNYIPVDSAMPFYRRGLELPEYDNKFIKRLNPNVALYNNFWISNNRVEFGDAFNVIPFYKLPEHGYYASVDEKIDLSEINGLLELHNTFVIELDGLINVLELNIECEYEKGVIVEKVEADIVSVSGLVVDHPGTAVTGVAAVEGWYYQIDGDRWTKIEHSDQCACNNNLRHELQFSLLRVLNESIKDKQIVAEDDFNYTHSDLTRA